MIQHTAIRRNGYDILTTALITKLAPTPDHKLQAAWRPAACSLKLVTLEVYAEVYNSLLSDWEQGWQESLVDAEFGPGARLHPIAKYRVGKGWQS